MKVLLTAINGKYYHTALGVYSLRAAAEEKGFTVCLKEWTLKSTLEQMCSEVLAEAPDVLGCSVYIWNIRAFWDLCALVKKHSPNTIIFWGGPEVTGRGMELLADCPDIDYLLFGEGELTFPALLASIDAGTPCHLPGVAGRQDGAMYGMPPLEKIDMALLPSPYRQMADWPDVAQLDLAHRIIYYETSRGCPFHCSFCFSGGDKPRYRPMEQVEKDLLYLMSLGIKQVKFVDRTFNFPSERCCRLICFLLDHYQPGINFHMEIAPNLLDAEFLTLLAKSPVGYLQMEAGIQTLYPPALKAMNRTMNWKRVQENLKAVIALDNCHLHVDLIAGLPMEGFAQFGTSFNGVYGLFAHQIQLGFLKVLPGSRLDREKETWGLVYQDSAPYEIVSTPQISEAELDRLRQMDKVIDCFFNCNRFRETFRYLLHNIEGYDPFSFFLRFGDYLPQDRKEWKQMPKRGVLLYDFLCMEYPEKMALWQDLLAIDWVLSRSGQRLPGFLSGKKVTGSWGQQVGMAMEKAWGKKEDHDGKDVCILHLQHKPSWDKLGVIKMEPGESYWAFSGWRSWGVLQRAAYLDVSACFSGESIKILQEDGLMVK